PLAQTLVGLRVVHGVTEQAVAASHYRLLCYTVNDTQAYQRLCQWGVDAVISDDPGRLTR
ncbi:hypothetical protein BIS06_15415, partial [Halomonas sp. BBD48]|nr:hypothetical protein [Halomonas sp. BBD48]